MSNGSHILHFSKLKLGFIPDKLQDVLQMGQARRDLLQGSCHIPPYLYMCFVWM